MEAAVVKLITILLSLPSFGVQADPNPPAAAEVMTYAPKGADLMMYVDFRSFVGNNYQALKALPQQTQIKRDPASSKLAREAVQKLDTALSAVKGMVNIDLVRDLHWAAGWIQVPSNGDPRFLIVVRGNLPPNLLDNLGNLAGAKPVAMGTGKALSPPGGGELIGLAADGTYMFGTASWVKARLQKRWRGALRAPEVTRVLDGKPFAMVASSPGKQASKRYASELSDPEAAFARDLATSHRFAAVALAHDGIEWVWHGRSRSSHEQAVKVSTGMIEVMRAGHLGTRGMARLALALAASYAANEPEIKALLSHEKAIMAVVEAVTGDGTFKVTTDDNASARQLRVRATGAELSDVVPMAGAVPLIAAGAFLGYSTRAATAPPAMAPPP